MGCCLKKQSSLIAIPLVQKQHEKYDFNIPIDSNSKWTKNGYCHLISTLELNLSSAFPEFPRSITELIAKFCHVGLKKPCNNIAFIAETMTIDDINGLLIHYIPDVDCNHYLNAYNGYNGYSQVRYDYIQSNVKFNQNIKGNVIYYEVKFIKILISFLKEYNMGISVGFRSENWFKTITPNTGANGGMLGWSKNTIGIHCDDGRVYCHDFNNKYGCKSLENTYADKHGDIIGCGYDYNIKHVFFTKNGTLISSEKVEFIDSDSSFDATLVFFCKVNMIKSEEFKNMTKQERECLVEFNFGTKSFEFDIDSYNSETIPKLMSFVSDIYKTNK
eukprot:492842_1